MRKFKCEKCAHENELRAILFVDEIEGWRAALSSEIVTKLEASKSKSVTGDEHDTLFLSTYHRVTLLEDVTGGAKTELELFKEMIAPALETVNKEFEIVGALQIPSAIDLAITDLSTPRAVFTFVTIKKVESLRKRLQAVGLERLLDEGACDTLGTARWP